MSTPSSSDPVRLRAITAHLRDQSGQAAVEFALILPLLLTVLFLITEFSRAFNAYNDIAQMAADGARMAAVNRLPDTAAFISEEGDTKGVRDNATITVTYPNGCAVGDTVKVHVSAPISIINFGRLNAGTLPVAADAEMRVEVAPTDGC